MKYLFLFLIQFYKLCLSPLLPHHCRFYPSFSCYAEKSIRRYGAWRGGWLTLKRIIKCAPWHPGGYDPVDPKCEESSEL